MIFIYFFLFTFIVSTLRLHFYLAGDKLSFIDRLLVTDPRINSILFLFACLIFIYIIFPISSLILGFDLSVLPYDDDLFSYMSYKKTCGGGVKIGENATVNVNAGKIDVSVDSKVAAAISASGGATAGIQAAKYVAGPPAVKLGAGVATAVAVQASTAIMSKVLGSNNSNNTGHSKFLANLIPSSTGGKILNDYPLNLLIDMNSLLICALVFLYIILNIYITKYIISKDLVKYIPASIQNHKIGKLFILGLNKYLNLWSKSSNYFLGFCYFMLLFCIVMCKLVLFIILSA